MQLRIYISFLLFLLTVASLTGQIVAKPSFSVEGEVLKSLKLSVDDLVKFNQVEIPAKDRDGKELIFKGVMLADVLDSAGVTLGKELRGENLVKYLLIRAGDGYEVIFSLPEVDPDFTDQVVLLAYQGDGQPLPSGEGPFRIIAPGDKRQARWIREVTTIKVVYTKE